MKLRLRHFFYFLILVTIDQISKYYARTVIKSKGPFSIIPKVLKLQYHENTGAVWGIMSDKTSLLSILTIVLIVLLTYVYLKIPTEKRYTPIHIIWVFIMSGAVGNFIDRICLKYVVDFIYFELIDFPIFNIADSYLTVSCILFIILGIFYYNDKDFAFFENLLPGKKKKADGQKDSGKDVN